MKTIAAAALLISLQLAPLAAMACQNGHHSGVHHSANGTAHVKAKRR